MQDLITLKEIKNVLKTRGIAVILMAFALPMAIPLPYPPGFTTILGIPIFLFSLQLLLNNKSPWFPRFIANKSFKRKKLANVIEIITPFFTKIEHITRPRLFMLVNDKAHRVVGFISLINSIFILLPLLFANALPSLGIFLMSLGLFRRDGIMVIIGVIISILSWFVAMFVICFGVNVASKFFFFLQ
ncbi:MAG: exopolysaccharide biosynthesis protein [Sphingobacteriia bacterium]|nr:exopolysaccharide biosynthesis protein [Sphingobacteriia bacterium]